MAFHFRFGSIISIQLAFLQTAEYASEDKLLVGIKKLSFYVRWRLFSPRAWGPLTYDLNTIRVSQHQLSFY